METLIQLIVNTEQKIVKVFFLTVYKLVIYSLLTDFSALSAEKIILTLLFVNISEIRERN